jgi:hypothetical protein
VGGRAHPHRFFGERPHLRSIVAQVLEQPGMLAQELGLLFQRVLRRLETADDHRMHDPGDLEVGELAVERLVVHVAQEADHVVLGVLALGADVVVDVLLEAVEASEHVLGLLRGELVLEPGALNEGHDDGIAPSRELWDVLERESEEAGHDALGQRPREAADELDAAVADPLVEQVVRVPLDHAAVAQRPRPDPRVGELLAVPDVELLRGAQ